MISSKYLEQKPKEVDLEVAVCVVCKTNSRQYHVFDASDRINDMPGLYGVDLCSSCGLYITNPRPTENTIGYYYPDSYGPYQSTLVDQSISAKKGKLHLFILKLLNTKQLYLPDVDFKPGQSKLLEIGCASGSFLHQMKVEGWDAKGLEFSEAAVNKALGNGLNVTQGGILDHDDDEDAYDLIVAWMVIEHIHDPVLAIEKIHSWLKPGGTFAFSIPNANSFDFKKLQKNSYGIHVPNHLYHFTPRTIKEILLRQGYKNVIVHHQVTMLSVFPSIGYALAEKGVSSKLSNLLISYTTAPRWLRLLFFPIAKLFAFLGQTGRMTIWAQK